MVCERVELSGCEDGFGLGVSVCLPGEHAQLVGGEPEVVEPFPWEGSSMTRLNSAVSTRRVFFCFSMTDMSTFWFEVTGSMGQLPACRISRFLRARKGAEGGPSVRRASREGASSPGRAPVTRRGRDGLTTRLKTAERGCYRPQGRRFEAPTSEKGF